MSILSKFGLVASALLVYTNADCGPDTCANFGAEYFFSLAGPTTPTDDNDVGTVSIGTQQQVSFDLYLNSVTQTGNWRSIFSVGDDNYPRLPAFWLFPNDNRLHIRFSDSGNINRGYDTSYELVAGELYQVVTEVCDGTVSSYVNNELVATISGLTTTTATDQSIFMGRRDTQSGSHVYDMIDGTVSNLEIKPCVDTRPCSCASTPVRCRVSGDPHFRTWDGGAHHYQGGGTDGAFYNYVTECLDDNGDELNNLPFKIVAEQSICNGPYTCIDQIVVEIEDDNGPVETVYFPSSGIPTSGSETGPDARNGLQSFTFNGEPGSYKVTTAAFEITFINVNGAEATLTLGYSGRTLDVRTCNCLLDQLCGLCGSYNGDPDDDFTRCDDGVVLDNTGAGGFRSMSSDTWANTLEFGDSCCNSDYDENGICPPDQDPGTIPLPDGDCTAISEVLCDDAYDLLCSCDEDGVTRDEFVENCTIDTCAYIAEIGGDITDCNMDANTCIALDYMQDAEDLCAVGCREPGSDAPTEEPTAEPAPLP